MALYDGLNWWDAGSIAANFVGSVQNQENIDDYYNRQDDNQRNRELRGQAIAGEIQGPWEAGMAGVQAGYGQLGDDFGQQMQDASQNYSANAEGGQGNAWRGADEAMRAMQRGYSDFDEQMGIGRGDAMTAYDQGAGGVRNDFNMQAGMVGGNFQEGAQGTLGAYGQGAQNLQGQYGQAEQDIAMNMYGGGMAGVQNAYDQTGQGIDQRNRSQMDSLNGMYDQSRGDLAAMGSQNLDRTQQAFAGARQGVTGGMDARQRNLQAQMEAGRTGAMGRLDENTGQLLGGYADAGSSSQGLLNRTGGQTQDAFQGRQSDIGAGYDQRSADVGGRWDQRTADIQSGYDSRTGNVMGRSDADTASILAGYGGRESDVMGMISGLGEQERADVSEDWKSTSSRQQQALMDSGMGGTVAASMASGTKREERKDMARLDERLRREQAGTLERLRGDTLTEQGRRSQYGTDMMSDLTGQGLRAGESASGQAIGAQQQMDLEGLTAGERLSGDAASARERFGNSQVADQNQWDAARLGQQGQRGAMAAGMDQSMLQQQYGMGAAANSQMGGADQQMATNEANAMQAGLNSQLGTQNQWLGN